MTRAAMAASVVAVLSALSTAGAVNTPPGAPGLAVADRPDDEGGVLVVTITASPDDGAGDDDVERYEVRRKQAGGDWALIRTVNATDRATYVINDDGLTNGTAYHYNVQAFDRQLASDPVTASGMPLDNTKPRPPRNLSITDVPDDQGTALQIGFAKSPDDGAGVGDVIRYDVQRKRPGGNFERVQSIDATGATSYHFIDNGVTPGDEYVYRVRAYDGTQSSDPLVGRGTPIDNLKPAPPGSLQITDHPGDEGRALDLVIGKSPDDGGGAGDVRQYQVFRQEGTSAFEPIAQIRATGADSYSFTDTGRTPGTEYTYQARAFDGTNLSDPATASGTPQDNAAPSPPANVTVSDVPNDNGGVLEVSFEASKDDGRRADDVVSYEVMRKRGSEDFAPLTTVTATDAASYGFSDSTVVNNVTYTYRVRAFDGTNTSPWASGSGKALDDTPPAPPATFTVVATPNMVGAADISFQASPDDTPAHPEVRRYEIYRKQDAGAWPTEPAITVPGTGAASYSVRDTGLTLGQQYTYKARAVAPTGQSEFTTERTITAGDLRKPRPPRNVTARDRPDDSGGAVYVRFLRSPDDGGGRSIVRTYNVFRQLTSTQPGPVTCVTTVTANGSASYQILDTGPSLEDFRTYTYWVVAYTATGVASDDSNTAEARPEDNIILAAPTTLTARDRPGDSGGAIILSWTRSTSEDGGPPPPPPPSGPRHAGGPSAQTERRIYEVFRRQAGEDWPPAPSKIVPTSVTGNPLTTLDSGLPNGVQFEYRVRLRINSAISPFSNIARAAASAGGSAPSAAGDGGGLTVTIANAPQSATAGSAISVKVRVEGKGESCVRLAWTTAGSGTWWATTEMTGKGAYDAYFSLAPGDVGPGDEVRMVAVAAEAGEEVQSEEVGVQITR